MIVLPAGDFALGSPDSEPGRYQNEGPQQKVHVRSFAINETEVTRAQFARFIAATRYSMDGGCYTPGDFKDLRSDLDPKASWRSPGFKQADDHPAVCISWYDAKAYAEWMSRRSGHRYRLPTEAEWEYAARGGSTSPYFWGSDAAKGCRSMNGGDLGIRRTLPEWATRTREEFDTGEPHSVLVPCDDGSVFTSPVKHYRPNAAGLYDMTGNAWEWAEDCGDIQGYEVPYGGASGAKECKKRRTRGGSWDDWPVDLRSAVRKRLEPGIRRDDLGFRLVREVDS